MIIIHNRLSNSGHVESGNDGGETEGELGGTFHLHFSGFTGEGILTIVLSSSGGSSVTTGSDGISSSWGEVSTAGTFLSADISDVIIGASNLSGDGSEKSNGGEFHFCFKFIYYFDYS
jgi:hypothetical protein